MPEQQTEERSNPQQEDQDISNQLREQRRRDFMLQNQAADNYSDDGEGEQGEEAEDAGEEGAGAESVDAPRGQSKQPASPQVYFLFGCFAFLIDVLIDMIGGFIFLSPVSFALGLCFKVPAYYILTSGGRRETLVAKRVVMMVCAIIGLLPGDNLAAVCISCFIDYKDKLVQKAGKLAALTGRKDIAMAAKIMERGSGLMDKARGLDQRDRERGIQNDGGRWRPQQQLAGNSKISRIVAGGGQGKTLNSGGITDKETFSASKEKEETHDRARKQYLEAKMKKAA